MTMGADSLDIQPSTATMKLPQMAMEIQYPLERKTPVRNHACSATTTPAAAAREVSG